MLQAEMFIEENTDKPSCRSEHIKCIHDLHPVRRPPDRMRGNADALVLHLRIELGEQNGENGHGEGKASAYRVIRSGK